MAKLYTPLDFSQALLMFLATGDVVAAQTFFADELRMRIILSGLPPSSDVKAVALVGRQVFGEVVADHIIRRCVSVSCVISKS